MGLGCAFHVIVEVCRVDKVVDILSGNQRNLMIIRPLPRRLFVSYLLHSTVHLNTVIVHVNRTAGHKTVHRACVCVHNLEGRSEDTLYIPLSVYLYF